MKKSWWACASTLRKWCYDKVELREANLSQIRQHFLGVSTPTSDEASD